MIIDGKEIASKIERQIQQAISHLKHRKPGLAFVCVGDHPSSKIYVAMKKKKCEEVGIISFDREFSSSISEEKLIEAIAELNVNPDIDGILVQMPLPSHISTTNVVEAIDPRKDVDGFHPLNMGKLLIGDRDTFIPCTPHGIHILLTESQVTLLGKHVVIVGRSTIVGKPLAALLMQKAPHCNATVTIAHSMTENLKQICQSADILVAAIGQPEFIKADMVKKGAVVIDVGINRIPSNSGKYKVVGDVDFQAVSKVASSITPVPGGVGPMTIAMLLSNTLLSYQRRLGI